MRNLQWLPLTIPASLIICVLMIVEAMFGGAAIIFNYVSRKLQFLTWAIIRRVDKIVLKGTK